MDEIRKDCPVYLLCYTGQKSEEIAQELNEQGYEVYSIKNGYRAWLKIKLSKMMADHNAAEQRTKDIERSIIKKFRKPIWRRFTKAIREYELVQDGDKIAVCISGGKDSMLMAKLFQELSRHGKKNFEVVFLVMNPGYNEINCISMNHWHLSNMQCNKKSRILRYTPKYTVFVTVHSVRSNAFSLSYSPIYK